MYVKIIKLSENQWIWRSVKVKFIKNVNAYQIPTTGSNSNSFS